MAHQETQESRIAPLNGQVGANLRSTLLERFYKQVAMDSSSLLAGREMEWGIFFVEV